MSEANFEPPAGKVDPLADPYDLEDASRGIPPRASPVRKHRHQRELWLGMHPATLLAWVVGGLAAGIAGRRISTG